MKADPNIIPNNSKLYPFNFIHYYVEKNKNDSYLNSNYSPTDEYPQAFNLYIKDDLIPTFNIKIKFVNKEMGNTVTMILGSNPSNYLVRMRNNHTYLDSILNRLNQYHSTKKHFYSASTRSLETFPMYIGNPEQNAVQTTSAGFLTRSNNDGKLLDNPYISRLTRSLRRTPIISNNCLFFTYKFSYDCYPLIPLMVITVSQKDLDYYVYSLAARKPIDKSIFRVFIDNSLNRDLYNETMINNIDSTHEQDWYKFLHILDPLSTSSLDHLTSDEKEFIRSSFFQGWWIPVELAVREASKFHKKIRNHYKLLKSFALPENIEYMNLRTMLENKPVKSSISTISERIDHNKEVFLNSLEFYDNFSEKLNVIIHE